jgi:hypothetical protein
VIQVWKVDCGEIETLSAESVGVAVRALDCPDSLDVSRPGRLSPAAAHFASWRSPGSRCLIDLYGVDVTQQAFLSQPIRDVEVRYVKQISGPGAFAIVTLDFEPWAYGFELAIPGDVRLEFSDHDWDYESVFRYVDALAKGITEELGTRPDLDVRTKVILRRMGLHLVDSNEMAFRHAGRLAVRAALERFAAITPGATAPSPAPGHPTTG